MLNPKELSDACLEFFQSCAEVNVFCVFYHDLVEKKVENGEQDKQ